MHELIFSVFPNENFVDLGLYQYGWEQCEPSHSYGPAARNHYLFHYVISGTGTLMSDDSNGVTQTFQVKSGQGYMLFHGQITTYIADKNLPWEYADLPCAVQRYARKYGKGNDVSCRTQGHASPSPDWARISVSGFSDPLRRPHDRSEDRTSA